MPTVRVVTVQLAGTNTPNILTGSQFEFLGVLSRVQVYGIQDTTPALLGVGEVEIFFGQELQLSLSPVNLKGAGPEVPEDLLIDDFAAGGDRLVVRVNETGGVNPATLNVLVKITPQAIAA